MTKKNKKRIVLNIVGTVQGVGFRPFVYRLCQKFKLNGFIQNTSAGVFLEAEGNARALEDFLHALQHNKPAHSFYQNFQTRYLDVLGYKSFIIKESRLHHAPGAFILPDIATCVDCLREIFDPANRRYLYPFTNCTHCGPRYSIIASIPYDRQNTSMKQFVMCPACLKEYREPADRRFHAQPNACGVCGPHLECRDHEEIILASHHDAVLESAQAIKDGKIVAMKGLGGFHLMVDAQNEVAINRLRLKKGRAEKAFALMVPDLVWAKQLCVMNTKECALLESCEAPIVLLKRKHNASVASAVAPSNPYLGLMLPYTPLHHLLMKELARPVVATSANISEESICIDEHEAFERLAGIADIFLTHNRPILRALDDSIVRLLADRPMVLRRARGYAPLPVTHASELPDVLAFGGALKSSIALNNKNNTFISQHIGEINNSSAFVAYTRTLKDLQDMLPSQNLRCACDKHPDYLSTQLALAQQADAIQVQHHHAHIVSCMAENHISGDVLGIAWDGTGFGDDQSVWGGEFLRCNEREYQRLHYLRLFPLPGGERAVKEPRRAAMGLLWELSDKDFSQFRDLPPFQEFDNFELNLIKQMMTRGINSVATSSMGRLFDGVASLTGLCQNNSYEGQGAMQIEFACQENQTNQRYPFLMSQKIINWAPMIEQIIQDYRSGISTACIARKFHNTLVEMALQVCHYAHHNRVVLSGGCFQNKYLTECLIARLKEEKFCVYWHQLIPPNDGGIALGQAVVAGEIIRFRESKRKNLREVSV